MTLRWTTVTAMYFLGVILSAPALHAQTQTPQIPLEVETWQGTVTVVNSYRSESDKTEVVKPNGQEECSFTLRAVARSRDEKTTRYMDFQLLADAGEEQPNGWRGTARANVTINASYYTLDVRKNAQCGVLSPPNTYEQGYETTTSGDGVGQGEVRFFRYSEPGSSRATCHIEADVEREVAKVPEVGRRWETKKGNEAVKQQFSLRAGSVSNFSFDCDPLSTSYSGQKKKQMSPNANDIEVVTWNIRRGPGKTDAVAIDGCAHLVKGGIARLTAKGKPLGGVYSWSANPSSVFGVSGSGENAIVAGDACGRATVEVEYRTPEGKSTRGTLPGSVAEVRSINGGAAISQIGLRDENGKEAPPVRIPIVQTPPEGDLLDFPAADASVATIANEGSSLLIQGLHVGKTTAQAQTSCHDKTGPVLNLDVVRCTKETIDKMLEKEQKVLDRFNEKAKKAQELVAEPGLKEAAEKIWKHAGNALLKASEVVFTGASAVSHLKGAAEFVEHAVSLVNGGLTTWSAVQGNTAAILVTAAPFLYPMLAGTGLTYELYHSWHEWLGDVKKIVSTTDQVQELLAQCARDLEELEYLADRREKICGKGKTDQGEPPAEPPAEPPTTSPAKTEHPQGQPQAPGEPEPTTPTPPAESQGEPSEPPIIADPEFPTSTPSSGGFILPQECGCNTATGSSWDSSAAGLKAMSADLARIQGCAQNFENGIKAFGQDMKQLNEAMTQAQQAVRLSQQEGVPKLEAAVIVMKASVGKIQEFSKAAESVKPALKGCEEASRKAGDLLMKAPQQEMDKRPRSLEVR